MIAPPPAPVAAAFSALPDAARATLMTARAAIFEAAEATAAGPLTECLKWGQPSYLTGATKSGTPLRLGLVGGDPAVMVHCQTTLIDGFRRDFPDAFPYSGTRALILAPGQDPAALALCLSRALTYHRDKRSRS